MSTLELKELLKSKIDKIDDNAILSQINTILNRAIEPIIMLTNEQKISIKKSQIEYLEDNYIENNILNEEMEKWLNE